MSGAHGTVGTVTMVLALFLVLIGLVAWRLRPGPARRIARGLTDVVVATAMLTTVVAVGIGALLLATGSLPAQAGLHVVLAMAALASLPHGVLFWNRR